MCPRAIELRVAPSGLLYWRGVGLVCALGKAGVTQSKREGDHATPAGLFPLRAVMYRADRIERPETGLPLKAIAENDGWCDDPGDGDYNRLVELPHRGRCESLWREDRVYDLICVIGYNDNPVVKGAGSAIFLHVAKPDYAGTEGCVALALQDLQAVLKDCGPGSSILIES